MGRFIKLQITKKLSGGRQVRLEGLLEDKSHMYGDITSDELAGAILDAEMYGNSTGVVRLRFSVEEEDLMKKFVEGQCHDCGRLGPVAYTGKQGALKIYKCKRCLRVGGYGLVVGDVKSRKQK